MGSNYATFTYLNTERYNAYLSVHFQGLTMDNSICYMLQA